MQETLAERLFRLRNEKKLTQEAVAEAAGISRVALTRYENGQRMPKMNIVASLAEIYGVTVDYLMGRDDPVANMSPESQALWQQEKALLEQMTPEQRDRVKEYMRFLLSQHHKSEA